MRFHKLEMAGFKSFVDKTTITFQQGMTAVVGPNGCGKSNISDAIRWVLGEKSAKNLRGEKMEDVIFNGSDLRKPVGMAEVNLTLQDVAGSNALGFAEFKEITITRRLYRNGDSEYLINKIPCRLKDIRDLLMDTGVGSRAYSIIEQGKVGQLVVSKPEERRYIIEEVAGITKYKARKNEALSKLTETEDNLSRVSDILHEVKRQIASVDRQAKKAERYKRLSGELKNIELKMAWDEFGRLKVDSDEASSKYDSIKAEEDAARNSVSAREAGLSEARLTLAEKERGLMDFQREIHNLESEAGRLEARAELAVSQLDDLAVREGRLTSEREGLTKEATELDVQSSSLKEEQQALKDELDRLTSELATLEAAFQQKANGAHQMETRIEEERGRLFDLQAAISHEQNSLTRLNDRLTDIEARTRRAADEERETQARHTEHRLTHDKKKLELDEARVSGSELERQRQAASAALDEARLLLKKLEAELARGRDIYSQKSSRLQSLKELEEGLDGCSDGVKALMAGKKQGNLPGIHGLLADLMQVKTEHEKAVEAALGDGLQKIIVDGHSDARTALDYLREGGRGRGAFMPVSPRRSDRDTSSFEGDGGVVGIASKLVQAKSGYEAVLGALLGGTLIVKDLDAALTLWGQGANEVLVTLDGEVLEPNGALSGGVATAGGILTKKREIRELTDETERLEAENRITAERLSIVQGDLTSHEASLKRIIEAVNEKRLMIVGLERDLQTAASELDRVVKKLEVIGIESAQRAQEDSDVREAIALGRTTLAEHEDRKLKKDAEISGLQEELKAAKAMMEADREALTAKKMELSALIQRHESSVRDIKRADMHREELGRKAARLDVEEKDIAARREELDSSKKDAEENINRLMRAALEKKEGLPAIQDAYQTASDAIATIEEAVKLARHVAEECSRGVSDLEIKKAELRLKLEHLEDTVARNYHMLMDEITEDIRGMEIDKDEADMNVSELRIKLERLGPVNVGAIEEYNELMERFTFLNTQKEDLESSVKSLREAIGKINKTSEELFMDAFNSINETFKQVFVSLFGGGQAELRLALPENGDVLDAGLEIAAQPPGKKLQNLTLFSGGEKALIAAALVFACFLVKPSPFCVLDEVDAPLDESNVQRFGNMLKDFADKTQFIVVTHSRPTMELADALYGVTMHEPGISRLVSVKLKEAEELAEV